MIDNKFSIEQRVKILPIENMTGIVIAIMLDNIGIGYKVRYFLNGKCEEVYFFGWELDSQKEQSWPVPQKSLRFFI